MKPIKFFIRKQLFALAFVLSFVSCSDQTRVACMGDSITDGGGQSKSSFYPVHLNQMLGDGFEVLNFGESGATMQTDADKPYWHGKDLLNVFAYKPEIVVLMLGTNDSKTHNWNAANYERDYQVMIDSLSTLTPKPAIYLCFPPPAYSSAWAISDSTIRAGVIPIVKRIARKNNLQIINVYQGMEGMSERFPDGIHPDDEGRKILAGIVYNAIKQ